MTYDEISKMLFHFGFTEGFGNIRTKKTKDYKLVASFPNYALDNIYTIYISAMLNNTSQSLASFIVEATDYGTLEHKLETLLDKLKPLLTKFSEDLASLKEEMQKQNIVKNIVR